MYNQIKELKLEIGKGIRTGLYGCIIGALLISWFLSSICGDIRGKVFVINILIDIVIYFCNVMVLNLMMLNILRYVRRIKSLSAMIRRLLDKVLVMSLIFAGIWISVFFLLDLFGSIVSYNIVLSNIYNIVRGLAILCLLVYNAIVMFYIADEYSIKDAMKSAVILIQENIKVVCRVALQNVGWIILVFIIHHLIMGIEYTPISSGGELGILGYIFIEPIIILMYLSMIIIFSFIFSFVIIVIGSYCVSNMLFELVCLYEISNLPIQDQVEVTLETFSNEKKDKEE